MMLPSPNRFQLSPKHLPNRSPKSDVPVEKMSRNQVRHRGLEFAIWCHLLVILKTHNRKQEQDRGLLGFFQLLTLSFGWPWLLRPVMSSSVWAFKFGSISKPLHLQTSSNKNPYFSHIIIFLIALKNGHVWSSVSVFWRWLNSPNFTYRIR